MVHLHTHSMYSLRDSIIRPEDFVQRLKEIGQDTIAITDHGGSLGGVTLYQTLKANGIRYIHGCEFYICDDTSVRDKNNKYYQKMAYTLVYVNFFVYLCSRICMRAWVRW